MADDPTAAPWNYDPNKPASQKYLNPEPSDGRGQYFEIDQQPTGQWHIYNTGTKIWVPGGNGIDPSWKTYASILPTATPATPAPAPAPAAPAPAAAAPPPAPVFHPTVSITPAAGTTVTDNPGGSVTITGATEPSGFTPSDTIKPDSGVTLDVKSAATGSSAPEIASQEGQPSSSNSAVITDKFHIVQHGDTLSGIAAANNMSLAQIIALNPSTKSDPNLIFPGERINLGGDMPSHSSYGITGGTLAETNTVESNNLTGGTASEDPLKQVSNSLEASGHSKIEPTGSSHV